MTDTTRPPRAVSTSNRGPAPLPFTVLVSLLIGSLGSAFAQQSAPGVRVPEGFRATLFADDDLAHDIHSLTIDSLGRVVVSGPGYVRILLDQDRDGVADEYRQFVDGPRTGAQGMFFDGRSLLCSGDAGLQIFRDDNEDDRADGPPEVFRRAMAGGEHHVHAIRRGPDGWWYVIAGNYAGITDAYVTLPGSPVKHPEAGVLMRLSPDFRDAEIVADGFRNAYDFAITSTGDFFTYDSDGERDVSLPWYRPTRAFHVVPMSHAGWVSRSWKRPDDAFDMPPVVGSFGRGSPTGVVCYRHTQFPANYRDSVFILDWTYGRVIALPLTPAGAVWSSDPIEFMTGTGSFGFAPTDVAVGPDGSLFVSVGGRGTRGGVYRVTYEAGAEPKPNQDALEEVLQTPQPLSSWARRRWVPAARRLGAAAFEAAALNEKLTESSRVRAIEILTELFSGLRGSVAARVVASPSERVRARAAWALGRQNPGKPNPAALIPFLSDRSPLVRRFAIEALQSARPDVQWDELIPTLANALTDSDRRVRVAAARVCGKLTPEERAEIAARVNTPAGTVALGLAMANRSYEVKPDVLQPLTDVLVPPEGTPAPTVADRLDAARVMQLALGDLGPREGGVAAFDGYASRADLTDASAVLKPIRKRLANAFPTGSDRLDTEVSRLLAMLRTADTQLLDRVLARIGPDSHPLSDIHSLLVVARISGTRTTEQTAAIATALLRLDSKLSSMGAVVDSNWGPRISELYQALVEHDLTLPEVVARQSEFGRPGHVLFLRLLSRRHLPAAIEAFAAQIESRSDYPWTNDVVRTLARSDNPKHAAMIRSQADNPAVRNAVLIELARNPIQSDRPRLVAALDSPDRTLLTAAVNGLTSLPKGGSGAEFVALVRAARRLGTVPAEFPLRERIIRLLRRNTGQAFGFVLGADGKGPQTEPLRAWTQYVTTTWPNAAAAMNGGADADVAAVRKLMQKTDWSAGDANRGRAFFRKHGCAQCHGGRAALGPDLSGVTGRFSRDDLFLAIAAPNRDVSSRYRTTLIQTTQGKVHQGLVIYRSVDGLLLRTSLNETVRVESEDIEVERAVSTSLMPVGALRDATSQDLADLYKYLAEPGTAR